MNDIYLWILGTMSTVILGFLGYFFKENISILKALKKVVEDLSIKFAVHEESNKAMFKVVDNHEERLSDIEKSHVELKLKVNYSEEILKRFKDGTYN